MMYRMNGDPSKIVIKSNVRMNEKRKPKGKK